MKQAEDSSDCNERERLGLNGTLDRKISVKKYKICFSRIASHLQTKPLRNTTVKKKEFFIIGNLIELLHIIFPILLAKIFRIQCTGLHIRIIELLLLLLLFFFVRNTIVFKWERQKHSTGDEIPTIKHQANQFALIQYQN